jgi:hypothetical protein
VLITILNAVWDPFVISLGLIGGVLVGIGLRGSARFLVQQECARCRHAVGDRPGLLATTCSECGADLNRSDGIRFFRRRRRPVVVFGGVSLIALEFLLAAVVDPILVQALQRTPGARLPETNDELIALFDDFLAPTGHFGRATPNVDVAAVELATRLREGTLPEEAFDRWFAATLRRMRTLPYQDFLLDQEADGFRAGFEKGWLEQSEIIALSDASLGAWTPAIPPAVRAGSHWPVPVPPGGMNGGIGRSALTTGLELNGEPLPIYRGNRIVPPGGADPQGIPWGRDYGLRIPDAPPASDSTGTLVVHVDITHELLRQPLFVEQRVVTLPIRIVAKDGPAIIERRTGPELRARVERLVTLRRVTLDRTIEGRTDTADGAIQLVLRVDGDILSPDPKEGLGLAYEVVVLSDGKEYRVAAATASGGRGDWYSGGTVLPPDATIDDEVTVILRPYDSLAESDAGRAVICGETFVFERVPVERGPSLRSPAGSTAASPAKEATP